MFSYFEQNFIEKILLGKCFFFFFFFKFWPKSKWREIRISYLAAILKWCNFYFFFLFFGIMIFIVYTYMVQISSQNSAGKVVFYGWVPIGTPLLDTDRSISRGSLGTPLLGTDRSISRGSLGTPLLGTDRSISRGSLGTHLLGTDRSVSTLALTSFWFRFKRSKISTNDTGSRTWRHQNFEFQCNSMQI